MILRILLIALQVQGAAVSVVPLTICELYDNLRFYNGKQIVIRGQLSQGEEGTYLTGEKCEKELVTNGYTWQNPAPLWLLPSRTGQWNDQSVSKRVRGATGGSILVTVVGRLTAKESYEIVRRGDGRVVPFGFGHLNASPAQLVYWEVKEVSVAAGKNQIR